MRLPLVVLVTLLAVPLLAACGDGDGDGDRPAGAEPSATGPTTGPTIGLPDRPPS